jgi:hypothetical protein
MARAAARSVRAPLSWDLRDFPGGVPDYPFGEDRPTGGPAFQKFIPFAVLLPESFRGGCSFGASQAGLSREGLCAGRDRAPSGGPPRCDPF